MLPTLVEYLMLMLKHPYVTNVVPEPAVSKQLNVCNLTTHIIYILDLYSLNSVENIQHGKW